MMDSIASEIKTVKEQIWIEKDRLEVRSESGTRGPSGPLSLLLRSFSSLAGADAAALGQARRTSCGDGLKHPRLNPPCQAFSPLPCPA